MPNIVGLSASTSTNTGVVTLGEGLYTDTYFSGMTSNWYLVIDVAVESPPANVTVRNVPIVSVSMPTPTIDSNGRPS